MTMSIVNVLAVSMVVLLVNPGGTRATILPLVSTTTTPSTTSSPSPSTTVGPSGIVTPVVDTAAALIPSSSEDNALCILQTPTVVSYTEENGLSLSTPVQVITFKGTTVDGSNCFVGTMKLADGNIVATSTDLGIIALQGYNFAGFNPVGGTLTVGSRMIYANNKYIGTITTSPSEIFINLLGLSPLTIRIPS